MKLSHLGKALLGYADSLEGCDRLEMTLRGMLHKECPGDVEEIIEAAFQDEDLWAVCEWWVAEKEARYAQMFAIMGKPAPSEAETCSPQA